MDDLPTGCVLKERYRFVLAQRAAGKTWREIGAMLDVSASRAQQLAAEVGRGLRRTYDTPQELEQQWRWRTRRREAGDAWEGDDGFDLGP